MIETLRTPQTIAEKDKDSEGSIADSSVAGMDTSSYGGSYEPPSPMSMQHLMALEVKPDDADAKFEFPAAEAPDAKFKFLAVRRPVAAMTLAAEITSQERCERTNGFLSLISCVLSIESLLRRLYFNETASDELWRCQRCTRSIAARVSSTGRSSYSFTAFSSPTNSVGIQPISL